MSRMLPKKRKFDLSTFDLERGASHSSTGVVVTNSSVTVTVTSSKANTGLPHPLPYTVRPSSIHEGATSRAVPAPGFLPPETVHEAFAGSSFLKSGGRDGRLSRVRGGQSPGQPPGQPPVVVDLSQSSSAFSRPSASQPVRVKPPYDSHSQSHSQSFKLRQPPGQPAGVSLVLETEQASKHRSKAVPHR